MTARPAFGLAGTSTPPPRLGLPLLRSALELRIIGPKLRDLLEAAGARGLRVAADRLVDGKQGSRAVIEYELESTARGRHGRVVAKHFAARAQARRVYRAASSLSDSRPSCGFAVPQPIGWLPELGLVVYVPVEGPSLDEAILQGNGEELVRRTAEALALLHSARLPLDRRFDLRQERLNINAWAGVVATAYPDRAGDVLELADELESAARAISVRADVPIHKDFHYQHVVAGQELALLDLDEMRFGDPSFDVAHFCAYLELLAVRTHNGAEAVEPLTRSFLAEYARCTGWKADERFDFFAAYTYLKIAKQLATARGVRPRPSGAERRAQLAFALERGGSLAKTLA